MHIPVSVHQAHACMVQPSRLGSCTAESWYVCLPYRHLSWFAVRRPSICLLLCAACAPLCRGAYTKRFAQARPHSDSRMDFLKKTLIFVPPRRSKRVAAARTRYSALSRSQLSAIQPANKLTERSSTLCAQLVHCGCSRRADLISVCDRYGTGCCTSFVPEQVPLWCRTRGPDSCRCTRTPAWDLVAVRTAAVLTPVCDVLACGGPRPVHAGVPA